MDTSDFSPTNPEVSRPLFTRAHGHYFRAAVIGTLVGVIAVGFQWALAIAEHWRESLLKHLHGLPRNNWWAWTVLPALGLAIGSLVGWMVKRWAPDAPGSGIPHI